MKRYTKKQILYHIIRGRMCYLETIIKENQLSAFAISVAKFDLEESKKKHPYCWRTRKKILNNSRLTKLMEEWRKDNEIN